MKRPDPGFSLIELMIALMVIGILAAIVFPSYQSYIRKSHRADAKSHLMNLAQAQQQYLMDAHAYATTSAALNVTTPSSLSGYYTITEPFTVGATPPTFSISAAPTGDQVDDSCGTLTIQSDGTKTSSSGSNCW